MDFSRLDKFLEEHLAYYGFHGCDAGVVYKGETVYRKQFGIDDCETGKKIDGNELYYIFSASKPITCTGAMRLVERGLLDLDAPVSKYLPEYKNVKVRTADGSVEAKNVMTVRNIFTMTAGFDYNLRSDAIMKGFEKNPDMTTREVAYALSEFPLHFEPGTKYMYSLCHDVLAAVVEVVADMKFSEYQKKNIFEPLGMKDSCFHIEESDRTRFAAQYVYDPDKKISNKRELACPYTLSKNHDSGGAGMISSVEDYLKFVNAMSLGGTTKDGYVLLKKESIDEMRRNQLSKELERMFTRRPNGYSYGLGVRTLIDKEAQNAKSALGEFGWDGAACAYLLIDPENQVGIFYGQNTLNCAPMYSMGHPMIRDLAYEGLGL